MTREEVIKVVIDISKHEWKYLNKLVENGDQLGHYERLLVNGTPLPKGYGRLIDADKLLTERMKTKYYHLANGDTAIPLIDIEHAPTIIEADMAESEG